jgi:hypothetical protein
MGVLIAAQVWEDIKKMLGQGLWDRVKGQNLTSVELAVVWGLIGLALYACARRGKKETRKQGDKEKGRHVDI